MAAMALTGVVLASLLMRTGGRQDQSAREAVAAAREDPLRTEAVAAAEDFLDRYLLKSGRVVRTDQGGDTVSEGQAYALLLAAAIDDEARFRDVWAWTNRHLQRGDRLLAWRWEDGRVIDWNPAADADLIAAGALALGGQRFDDPALTVEASRISAAVLARETITRDGRRVLVAGPWARVDRVVNPSYSVVGIMSRLSSAVGDRRWLAVAASSRLALDSLTAKAPHLPPDWATVDAAGANPHARESPGGEPPRYGYDAARVLVQLAVDCRATSQQVAARAWPFLRRARTLVASYTLNGWPIDRSAHPLAYVAAAASAAAAGDADEAARLLDTAETIDDRYPTYYGAAWLALARMSFDSPLLGGCLPGHPT